MRGSGFLLVFAEFTNAMIRHGIVRLSAAAVLGRGCGRILGSHFGDLCRMFEGDKIIA